MGRTARPARDRLNHGIGCRPTAAPPRPGAGRRVTDAIITARVAPLALGGATRPLDPMVVAGYLTYCNYFRISPSDTTVIQAEIRRPDAARVIQARFVVEPHTE